MTTHDAGQLLRTFGQDISRFVNTLTDAAGVTVYTAEEMTTAEADEEGFIAVGEFIRLYSIPRQERETWFIELNPATGELRESY